MAKWVSQNMQDNGLSYLPANCNAVLLLKNYTAGDNYATINGAGVKVASAALVSGDFALAAGAAANSRKVTANISGKSGGNALINTLNGTDNLHVAFVKTSTSEVIWVTDESTDQTITAGNPVTFNSSPAYTVNQPT